jgi:hypothetical protein
MILKNKSASIRLPLLLGSILLAACGGGGDTPTSGRPYNVWQNPSLSSNPGNNIHNDSYLSDSYPYAGPSVQREATVSLLDIVTFKDYATGEPQTVVLGECASLAFDANRNIQTVCAGVAQPGATEVLRSVVTIDRNTLEVIAHYPFTKPVVASDTVDFGGAGYFYQDKDYRMVVAMPDGRANILRRVKSTVGGVDSYVLDANYNITGIGGVVTVPNSSLYALVPDKAGNIWFTTAQAAVGYIAPSGVIRWVDLNDPAFNDGTSGDEKIANSHAIDEGDSDSDPSGVYIVSTHSIYRFGADPDGTPRMVWKSTYDRGTGIKSGQVSFGSGTSPTVFRMNNRRFVTIADNAQTMNVNVYRAEATLLPGEQRLFAQVKPFGANTLVSDENSLVVAANEDGTSIDIYAENNWGNDTVQSTLGSAVTQPGFARMNLRPDGQFVVASVNNTIAVPSIVSKVSLPSNIIYTYNKTPDGWYITGLDATDLTKVRFTNRTGGGLIRYNNYYAGLSLDPDGKTLWLGLVFGLMKVQIQ